MGLLMVACSPAFLDPPRAMTATAMAQITPVSSSTSTPLATLEALPVEENEIVDIPAGVNPSITVWVNDKNPAQITSLDRMVADFTTQSGIHVEVIFLDNAELPDLMNTAVISDVYPIPDMVLVPLEYSVGWAEQGILDAASAGKVLENLDASTFDQAALELVTQNGHTAAVPSHGWQQVIVYRDDWFERENLDPPDDFVSLTTAGRVISDTTSLISGFVMPTESSLVSTAYTFEQIAIANGCHLIDEKGEVMILERECQSALEFYRFLCNGFCPPGVQTEVSARNAYLAGRTGMVMGSPAILPMLAGLDADSPPSCPECSLDNLYLVENSNLITTITGQGTSRQTTNFSHLTYLGITRAGNREAAIAFAEYWLSDGYVEWLSVHPELKVPLRPGTLDEPTRYLDSWYGLPLVEGGGTISGIFGEEIATRLGENIGNENRWGFATEHGGLMNDMYEGLTMSLLLQELLSGYFDANRAAIEGYKRVIDFIPDYAYYVDPEPTPTPEN